jgi:flavin-binding protein dodecin
MNPVYRTLQVAGTSSRSFQRAIEAAMHEAERAWQERGMFHANPSGLPVKNFTAHLERLDILNSTLGDRFRAELKVSFLLPTSTPSTHIRRISERV